MNMFAIPIRGTCVARLILYLPADLFSFCAKKNHVSPCFCICGLLLYHVSECHRGASTAVYCTTITAQHTTVQQSTAQHSTAQHSTAQHSTAQHSGITTHNAARQVRTDRSATAYSRRQIYLSTIFWHRKQSPAQHKNLPQSRKARPPRRACDSASEQYGIRETNDFVDHFKARCVVERTKEKHLSLHVLQYHCSHRPLIVE